MVISCPFSLKCFPRPPKCHVCGTLLAIFLALKIFICVSRRWLIYPLQTPQSHAIQNSIFSKGVSKTGKLSVCSSFVNGASSVQACHGTAHNMYYIIVCTCGIWYVASSPSRLVINHVCATWLSKAYPQIILHPPVQNANNPVSCAGKQLSHGNLNFAADSSSCSPHFSSEEHFAD